MNERREEITKLAQAIGLDVKEIFLNLRDPNVIPENGWVLQYKDGYFTPSMVKVIRSRDLEVRTSNNGFQDKINENVNIQRNGLYKITISCNWSIDATNSDIEIEATFDGSFLSNSVFGEIFKKEGKDATGNDGDGRGTSQIDSFQMVYWVNVTFIGSKNITLSFKPENNNVEAALWEATIVIEEIFI